MISYKDNTYLTDLKAGDLVVEHHKSTGLRYLSKVKSIDSEKIVVTRAVGSSEEDHSYGTDNGMIMYPYGTKIADFYLLKYESPNSPTPVNPGPVSDDAESLLPNYGLDANV